MAELVDVTRLTIASERHQEGPNKGHLVKDCPQDARCGVWLAWQPRPRYEVKGNVLDGFEVEGITGMNLAELEWKLKAMLKAVQAKRP
jgi:hypothetical protein